ncbi:cell wall protein DAN4-like [Mizuhopecten yessoensis]|uniref:Homeobox protein ceh-40 n=1 Tax=Mizuhopecten yessoensis TaxID=6573 RepID=A0A210QIW5_MIZYE|nr:cell wall protein DAN4-like [Mizuhopecten yessoensis]OWF48639.1 Homeobox protein ceh-40 [Mizuhopecten yessoensis]
MVSSVTHCETSTTRPYSETTTTRPHSETSTTCPHSDISTTRTHCETSTTRPHSETTTTRPYSETNTTRPHSETTTTRPHSETTSTPTHCETTTTSHPHCETSATRPYSETTTTCPHCDNNTYLQTTPLNKSTTASNPISESRPDSIFGLLSSTSPPSTPLLNHPFFCELRSVLLDECKKSATPNSLLSTFQPKSYSTVSDRERRLQQMFKRQHSTHGDEIQQLSSFYRYQAGAVEMERLQNLQDSAPTYHPPVNSYYDNQLHLIMDRVETSLEGLDTTTRERTRHQSEPLSAATRPLSRPVLSRKAIRLMEEWFYLNTEHPYPSPDVIHRLAEQGHVKEEQVKKWFSNKRSRTHNTKTLAEISKRRRRPQGPPGIIYLPSFDYR